MKPRAVLGLITIASLAIVSVGMAAFWNHHMNVGPYNVTFAVSGQEPYSMITFSYPHELKPDPLFGWLDGEYWIDLYHPEHNGNNFPVLGWIVINRSFIVLSKTICNLCLAKILLSMSFHNS
jgi:hypothetical protein